MRTGPNQWNPRCDTARAAEHLPRPGKSPLFAHSCRSGWSCADPWWNGETNHVGNCTKTIRTNLFHLFRHVWWRRGEFKTCHTRHTAYYPTQLATCRQAASFSCSLPVRGWR